MLRAVCCFWKIVWWFLKAWATTFFIRIILILGWKVTRCIIIIICWCICFLICIVGIFIYFILSITHIIIGIFVCCWVSINLLFVCKRRRFVIIQIIIIWRIKFISWLFSWLILKLSRYWLIRLSLFLNLILICIICICIVCWYFRLICKISLIRHLRRWCCYRRRFDRVFLCV